MRLRWTAKARDDLLSIRGFIARDDPTMADEWVGRIRRRARRAAEHPLSGRVVPEFGREEIREIVLRNYRIVYRASKDAVEILTVFEGHRMLPEHGLQDDPPG